MLPVIALIGRPNVGKSTLFNRLTRSRDALVADYPGLTRDRQYGNGKLGDAPYLVVDTGGLVGDERGLDRLMADQVWFAVEEADAVVFLLDARDGINLSDEQIARRLRRSGKPSYLALNKVDGVDATAVTAEAFALGLGEPLPIAAAHGRGVNTLINQVLAGLPGLENSGDGLPLDASGIRIAVVGRPNVGKSTLINRMLGEQRVLAFDQPGTTRDSIYIPFERDGREYTLIDTAGLRKSAKQEDDIEIIAAFKTKEAIRQADLLFLVIDAHLGPSQQDAKILELILEEHKMAVVLANKIDLFTESGWKPKFLDKIEEVFHFYRDIPVVFISALTRKGLPDLLEKIHWAEEKMHVQIPTPELNDFFFEAIRQAPAPVWGTTNVKFYYLTQTRQKPPAFIAFANHPEGVDTAYKRFLINKLKERFDLWGVPIRIFVMKSGKN